MKLQLQQLGARKLRRLFSPARRVRQFPAVKRGYFIIRMTGNDSERGKNLPETMVSRIKETIWRIMEAGADDTQRCRRRLKREEAFIFKLV